MDHQETVIVQGNEACVRGALAAGCRFFAGYPITPASEIAELMALRLPQVAGTFIQMEDEIASMAAVIGATWGGLKACTATSGPGFSLMQEGIGYAVETETPCVIINVQRGGPSTGQPTLSAAQDVMQAKYGSHGDYEIIALAPSSVQEAFELTVKAFNLAEIYRVPVIVLTDEIVGHTREKLHFGRELEIIDRTRPKAEPKDYLMYRPGPDGLLDGMPAVGQGYKVLVDGQLHDETGNRKGGDVAASAALVERLCRKITDHEAELTDIETLFMDDARTAILAYGSVARSARHAVKQARAAGKKVGYIKLKTLWPFPDQALTELLSGLKKVVVPEMNIGKINREVARLQCGPVTSLPKLGGAIHTPEEILAAVEGK